MAEHYPRFEEFFIGQNQSAKLPATDPLPSPPPVTTTDPDTVAVFEPEGLLPGNLLFVSVENMGASNFVFSAQQSDDNGVTDAFAAINVRFGGASVASVTVVPGGKVAVLIELITKKTVRFKVPNASANRVVLTPLATATTFPKGRIVAAHFGGELRRLERVGYIGSEQF